MSCIRVEFFSGDVAEFTSEFEAIGVLTKTFHSPEELESAVSFAHDVDADPDGLEGVDGETLASNIIMVAAVSGLDFEECRSSVGSLEDYLI